MQILGEGFYQGKIVKNVCVYLTANRLAFGSVGIACPTNLISATCKTTTKSQNNLFLLNMMVLLLVQTKHQVLTPNKLFQKMSESQQWCFGCLLWYDRNCTYFIIYLIVEKIMITKVVPFTALTSKIPFDITFNSISMDYPSTRLYCAYNSSNGIISERFQLTRNDGNSFTCKITSAPPTRDIVKLFFIIETIATSTSLANSNNVDFYFQEVIPLNYLDPFVSFSDFTTAISPSSVRVGSNSVILTDKQLYCQYNSNDGEHVTTYLQFQDGTTQLIVSNSADRKDELNSQQLDKH